MRDMTAERRNRAAAGEFWRYRQARWDEPLIFELSEPGRRGLLLDDPGEEIDAAADRALSRLPDTLRRETPPALPELSQVETLRHYLRLSQENLGAGMVADMGMATATMKYNPIVNERILGNHKLLDLHPLQPDHTVQGILEIMFRLEQILCEVSGMHKFSFQPRAGSAGIYTNASIIRAHHESRDELDQRNEMITTVFSHPSDAACPSTAGFNVITLYPDPDTGYPSAEALRAVLSERTAGIMLTNPDDTGIYNPHIRDFVDMVHEVGGLCAYDQANANGLLGVARAGDAGFDLCHFNLHKTFSTPHASGGPATGAVGASIELSRFLPSPLVARADGRFYLDEDRPDAIGRIGMFHGVAANFVRAYTWAMNLGSEGMRKVADVAALNNNYLMSRMLEITGVSAPYAEDMPRIDQVRYSWQELAEETGFGVDDLARRAADLGIHFFQSHHPYVVSEPATVEPTESYTDRDLDQHAASWAQISKEARRSPEMIEDAPHHAPIHRMDKEVLSDPAQWAMTWRAYRRKVAESQK
jgi:glycine dehydrogenase subunit 2